ncbi:28S ribosomal protein S9-like protein [Leptotrombidium deliense]|uniref:28S ribosomal protein S9-like protein n=1 Tax=Leptotrombidium deliense TaxID=299467 RepID=A0A443SEP7_9ACAR|nr:28S ribosomal protein S9-like protein [Leptotrombidium deliense]
MFAIREKQGVILRQCITSIAAFKGKRNELLNQKRAVCALINSKRCCASVSQNKIASNFIPNQLEVPEDGDDKIQNISKAMEAYLKNAKAYDQFMQERREEYEIGKRHLCNIMGWDPNAITQKDVDSAIEYLMPSGLFDLNARPVMYPPELIYEKKKEAEFDIQGRPHHQMFYTGKPNYYKLLHDIFAKFLYLNEFEDKMIKNGVIEPHPESKATLLDSEWLSLKELKDMLLEDINQEEYNYLIRVFENILDHPYSTKVADFLKQYRKEKISVSSLVEIPPLMYTEDGRAYITAEGSRKYIKAKVTVWGNGTGKITINGCHNMLYFPHFKEREQVMFPLQYTGLLMKVDVEINVHSWGPSHTDVTGKSSEAGAIRHGIALALRSFVDMETVEDMRIAGLLTRDRRVKERKKVAHRGARKRFAYRKR